MNRTKLIDARALPLENPADENDPEATSTKAALQAIFKKSNPTALVHRLILAARRNKTLK